ncbi:shikimate dehydrogenase family protein [Neolewinella litorea]|uniref:Shikimate dehydrogenase n=1 Tax=Neolewinella litorea TaxID=2562452 RepID=A0A4S4NNR4_9BACT|nr:shikimate dehydrogenase [Neolewinella litorea]THH41649.1 shikimate dehydrogenase [Neolewinella litorea]
MPTFGLLGFPLSHSFSRGYFTAKFVDLGIDHTHRYLNFEYRSADQFRKILNEYPDLRGVNVTIPHKQAILSLLDEVDPVAKRIGAVNTILVKGGRTSGFNTDYQGFSQDLIRQLAAQQRFTNLRGESALILGTGGAARAVWEALVGMGVKPKMVSRTPSPEGYSYDHLDKQTIKDHRLIVNTTPLGMHPNTDASPNIPYQHLSPAHFCYDLVYNPSETSFMKRARGAGAGASNGLGMLYAQAEAAWEIWNRE